jgi:hypothetical protein
MNKFFKSLALFSLLPALLIALLAYFYSKKDLFMDFKVYKNYSWQYTFQSLGDLATKKLLHSPAKYNSFILGSSRATSVYACYLQKKIPNSQFFNYANFAETIGGMYARTRLLDSLGYSLDNVLIYIDTDNSFANAGRPKINDHYLINNESKGLYYYNHFRFLLSDADAFKILLGFHVPGEPDYHSDPVTNDSYHVCSDSSINVFGDSVLNTYDRSLYDSLKKTGKVFYKRPAEQKFLADQIIPYDETVMLKMKELFHKHKTHYYIVITPLYDQMKFSPNDFKILKKIFGDHLYDFSGHNAFTNKEDNYPDGIHFHHHISKQMIDDIIKS